MNIYAFALAENIPALKHYSQNIVYEGIASSLKSLISCVINGKVYEESHRIYLVLDNFNAQDLSEIEYKEWVMFKNIAKESFGFSIGGLAALRKTTLISVKKIIDKFIVFEKIFVPSGILIHIELYGNPIANKKMKYQLGKKFTNHETNENIYKLITILFIC
jgi:tRNA 2-selenouridine synthase SelU